jgi:hypothetical protein
MKNLRLFEKKAIKAINSWKDDDMYSDIEIYLLDILNKGKLDNLQIRQILRLKNTFFISEFLIKYNHFDKDSLIIVGKYINRNLEYDDRLFVSDLIEFATYWNLDLPYEKCLDFLDRYKNDDHYVLLASMEYIFANLKFEFINKIVESLIQIIENPDQIQPAQVNAFFILFRITHKKEYLNGLIQLVTSEDHKELLKNILSIKYNNQQYFDFHDLLYKISE